jgi:hypothetical protein
VGNSFVAGPDTREEALKHLKRLYRDSQKEQGVAEGSKTPTDWMGVPTKLAKNDKKPIKRPSGYDEYIKQGAKQGFQDDPTNPLRKKVKEQGVAEGVAETLPMDDAVKVLRQYGADHFKTTSNELHFYKQGRPFSVDLVMNPDATRSVTLRSLNSATRGLKGQGVAESVDYKSDAEALKKQGNMIGYHKTMVRYYDALANNASHRADVKRYEALANKHHAASKGVAEEQLDELKCWSGYTRVQGVPAGAPGSCKKKTNEEGVAEVKKNNKNDDHEPFDYAKWKSPESNVKTRKPRGYKDAEALGKAIDSEQSELRKRKEQGVAEEQEEKCPHCGGAMFSEMIMNEKKDACYYKVKSRYKVWPSAYASGALVKCRKSGADSWGDGGKKNESSILEGIEQVDENLNKWFKEKWVRFGPDGKIRGDCARGDDSEGKPKCLPQSKAQNLGKEGRASAASRKRREDPNPERSGKAINVNTKKKSNEGVAEGIVSVGDTVWAKHPIQRYKSVTGKVLHTDDNSTKIQHRDGTTGTYPNTDVSNDYEELNPNPYRKKEQGMAEGGEKDRQWSNQDMERLRVATRDFDDIMASDGPDQTKHDLIKKRIQTKPMAGPKGVIPEQGMAEGSKKSITPEQMIRDAVEAYKQEAAKENPNTYILDSIKSNINDIKREIERKKQGVAEAQLDEKWSTKYKDSINCSNPKGFSQKAHCQGKNK